MWGHRSLILRLSFGVSISKVWEDWAEGNFYFLYKGGIKV